MEELAEITRQLLRSSPDALVVIDDRGRIRFANDTVTDLFGYSPEQVVGNSIEMLVPERLRQRHGEHIAAFISKPRNREMGARIADLFARRADGSEFAAEIRLAPVQARGKLFVAAAIRDATERRRINEELIAAREDADRANRAKSRFLATASHDLRQPLQAIRLLNAAMTKLAGNSELAGLLRHQEDAIESTTRLLNALLDISRLESGTIEPQRTAVSLPNVFQELRSEFEPLASARGLRLDIVDMPATVSTDRILFHQLLQNLVGNAIKYTDRGTVSITCSRNGNALSICIRDTGIGIPKDKLDRIFDEYYQVDTHGAKRAGVGLGLAIVREVAKLLGFRIAIYSSVGESTEVLIHIPADSLTGDLPTGMESTHVQAESVSARKGRVILVEDNDGVRVATELFLKLEGYETVSASSVTEAEQLLLSMRPGDIVVADFHLDMTHTGLDVLAHARLNAGRDVPGIILSGDLPTVLRTLKEPVPNSRFLGKPVDTKALLDAISELSVAQ